MTHTFAAPASGRIIAADGLWPTGFTGCLQRTGIHAEFVERTPRTLLAASWNMSLPDWLTDEMVMEEELLRWSVPVGQNIAFVDVVLSSALTESIAIPDLRPKQLGGILSSIAEKETWKVIPDRALLKNCLQDKCDGWKQRAKSTWESSISDMLLQDPQGLWRDMSILAVLRNYPAKHVDYLMAKERSEALSGLPDNAFSGFPLHAGAIESVIEQIGMFFLDTSCKIKNQEDLGIFVGCLSGRLQKEYQLLEQNLGRIAFDISSEDIEAIKRKFKDCEGVTGSRLDALKRFLKATRPECSDTAKTWGATDWLKWSTDKYFPFRQWQCATGTGDSAVEEMVQRFSDWYVNEYASVHQEKTLSLVHILTDWQNAIMEDELSVLVVADCVPVDFWDSLTSCLSRQGFSAHETGFRFSPLPTHTAVSKPMMISGQWNATTKPYGLLLEIRSKTDWSGRKVNYCADLKELTECDLKNEPTILLLNFLPTDEILHSDVAQINSTYEEEANRVFARLAESLAEVVERWPGPRDRIGLYVATDHGATRVLSSETKTLDSKAVAGLFADSKHRFAEVPNAEADSISQHLWDLGYRFKQPFVEKSPTYFIPKGHNTVAAGARKAGFMHGGATPEEVIVPVGMFRLTKAAWKTPMARFLDLRLDAGVAVIYIQRLHTLSIAVQNPNTQPIAIKDVRILTSGGEVRKCSRPVVSAGSEGTVSLECFFRQESKTQAELNVEIEYEISGQECAIGLVMKTSFRSAQAGGFQLKDLT